MKTRVFTFILLVLIAIGYPSCSTNNKEKKMKEVIIFNSYTVKLPLQAISANTNGWKIENSSSSLTTIIASQTTQANHANYSLDIALMKHNSQKFKLNFDSERTVDKTDFKVYIKEYKGKAGVSPIRFTCIVLDELNTQNRFIFELNSISYQHSYIVDSIVDSFKRNTLSPTVTINESEDTFQIFSSAGFKVKYGCKLYTNTVFIDMAKQQGINNIVGAYTGTENEDDSNIGCIVNINVYDYSEEYENLPTDYYNDFEKECLEKYAQNLSSANITYDRITYQGVNALEYSFDQIELPPAKAIIFYKNKRSYLVQIATRMNLDTKFNELKSNFTLIEI